MSTRESKRNQGISRRSFLMGGTLAAASVAAAGLAGCSGGGSAGPNGNLPESWDVETDVVIVGLGAAGLSAAIAAKNAGVEHVLCLEVAPEELSGGTTRVSGDMLMIPEDVESAITYQTELNAGYKVPEDWMRAWAEGVCGNMEWLTDELGYDLQPATAAAPEFPGIPGGDKVKTYYVDGICGMSSLWIPLRDTAEELGIEVMYEMRATELIYHYETKEVYGLVAGDKYVKAKKGVVLACGGFAANPEMMSNYGVSLGCANSLVCGSPYNVGDGVKMAQQIGADLWHMNSYAAASTCVRAVSPDSTICNIPYPMGYDYIYVDGEGKRFMYEECQRTPLLVRYPKAVAAGVRTKALAMNIDLAPTFVDMAGLEVPADMQGRSLKGVLTSGGKTPEAWRTGVYYHYYEYPSWHSVKRHYGVRTNDYKLIHFYNDVDEWELYDLKKDPYEMCNVYNDPGYAPVRSDMHARLEKLQQECGDTDPCEREYEFFRGADRL